MGTRKLSLVVVSALVGLLPSIGLAAPPDLCEEVVYNDLGQPYQDSIGQTISKWCDPHTNPPVWNGDVCCVVMDEANCVAPDENGRCSLGMKFSCQYGEQIGDGVACYQHAPSACAMGFCSDYTPGGSPFEDTSWLCCYDKGDDVDCFYAGEGKDDTPPAVVCTGFLAGCNYGQSMADGTVDCLG